MSPLKNLDMVSFTVHAMVSNEYGTENQKLMVSSLGCDWDEKMELLLGSPVCDNFGSYEGSKNDNIDSGIDGEVKMPVIWIL